MEIVPLEQRPDAIPVCARWALDTWGSERVRAPAAAAALWLRQVKAPGLPLRWAAVQGREIVGTASLVADDLPARPDLTPWLADVFVPPERRGHGVASALVHKVEAAAAERGLDTLYLHTESAQRLYARLGWYEIGCERDARGAPVTLMARDLKESALVTQR